ncbi:hypothetical protein Nekkels1_91 [Cellulophaga phage Nekkels_1]|uniref:Uncharacterized protein n=1 Tax=Cellulophaga phage Nekkels_1 TaxID=2745692 RepID=A0A8E4XXR6_9CAUD|nr:hypothetical protein M1M31_gp91 [Cellulophaga phage Nekkels_1]QQO97098.1 hypothetical protein Nekkels1_91 [Cellulophaga phage Nekkels_1]QQO97192.1 hypothetical protein Nekkels2_92 [Cellulophaga phage Nekkels_2]
MKEITINTHLAFMIKNGLKVFPVFDARYKFAVCIEDNFNLMYKSKKTIGEYKHDSKSINKALEQTLEHIYNKLNKN